jgi:hypothetical protein
MQTEEHKFGQNPFIFTLNENILPISTHQNKLVRSIGYNDDVREDVAMDMFKMLAPMFKLNINVLADTLPALPNGKSRPIAYSNYVKDKDLTDAEFAALDVERLEIRPLTHTI